MNSSRCFKRIPTSNPACNCQTKIRFRFHSTSPKFGQANKVFINGGGKVHSLQTCQLQVWLGPDEDHRLSTSKLASILEVARGIVFSDDVDMEIEYGDSLISQCPVLAHSVNEESATLRLTTKHTDCLHQSFVLSRYRAAPAVTAAD